jgi:hypothetical protein
MKLVALPLLALALSSFWACKDDKKSDDDEARAEPEPAIVSSGVQPQQNSGVSGRIVTSRLEEAKAQVTFAYIAGDNPDPDHVRTKLELPEQAPNGVAIQWSSTLSSVVGSNGTVNRAPFGEGDTSVTLTATFFDGSDQDQKTFPLIVIQTDPTDQQAVDHALAALTDAYVKKANPSLALVVGNLNMPQSWDFGVKLSWTSGLASVSTSGVVTRPSGTNPSEEGDLVVTAQRGTASVHKTLHARVLKLLPNLMITEVNPTIYSTSGWIEVLNTSAEDIQLSDYGFRACDNTYTCNPTTGSLPSAVIPPGKYLLIHKDHGFGEIKVDGKNDVFVTGLYFNERQGFFELTKANATVDFVRWQDSTHTVTTQPLTGSFTGAVYLPNGNPATTLGRKYAYNNSNSAADWLHFPKATPGGHNGTGAAPGTDTDGDGLTDDYETYESLTDPLLADTDGDWFTDGQEVLDSGVSGINIRELGANPLVRDIFVELDYMANPAGLADGQTDTTQSPYTLRFRKEALDLVRDAFANYVPDGNDLNQYPLQIHLDVGDLYDNQPGINPANYDLGGGNAVPFNRCLYLGTDGTHTAANCANVYQLKQDHFDSARRNVFHYFVVGWSQRPDGGADSSGLAELFGNDGLITVGSWVYGPGLEQFIVNIQAATLLHELGHNLGLKHGGDDDQNYKPNYVSSMNYEYQIVGLDHDDDGDVYACEMGYGACVYDNNYFTTAFKLGYSRGGRAELDETNLAEPAGWASVAIDFNGNGDKTDTGFSWNVQPSHYNTSNTNVLHDFDDWNALFLTFQDRTQSYWNGISINRVRTASTSSVDPTDEQPLSTPCLSRPLL